MKKITLHLGRIDTTETFLSFFFLLVFINPFLPVNLDVLIFLIGLAEPGPERLGFVLFNEDEKEMEASFCPFGLLFVDFVKEFKSE